MKENSIKSKKLSKVLMMTFLTVMFFSMIIFSVTFLTGCDRNENMPENLSLNRNMNTLDWGYEFHSRDYRVYVRRENDRSFVFVEQIEWPRIRISRLALAIGTNRIRIRSLNRGSKNYDFNINYTHEQRLRQTPYDFRFTPNARAEGEHNITWRGKFVAEPVNWPDNETYRVSMRRGNSGEFIYIYGVEEWGEIRIRNDSRGTRDYFLLREGLHTFRVQTTGPLWSDRPNYRFYLDGSNLVRAHYSDSEFAYFDFYVENSGIETISPPLNIRPSHDPLWRHNRLIWDISEYAVGYRVYIKRPGYVNFAFIEFTQNEHLTFHNINSFAEGSYIIRIQAVDPRFRYENNTFFIYPMSKFSYFSFNFSRTTGRLPPPQDFTVTHNSVSWVSPVAIGAHNSRIKRPGQTSFSSFILGGGTQVHFSNRLTHGEYVLAVQNIAGTWTYSFCFLSGVFVNYNQDSVFIHVHLQVEEGLIVDWWLP